MSKIAAGLLFSCVTIGLALGQTAEAPGTAGNTMKLTKWMLTVSDLDKTFAFYHETFGFELNNPAQYRKTAPGSQAILKLTNSPEGTMFRNVSMHSSGIDWYLELLEFTPLNQHPANFRLQDPGATYLRLQVRDIDRVVAAALKYGGFISSVGGRVVTVGKDKVVMLRDPDGSFLEVTQPAVLPETAPADGVVVGGNFVAVVKDVDKTVNFYKKQLGLDNHFVDPNTTENGMKMFGVPGARIHRGSIFVPGTRLQLEFIQFKNIRAHPVRTGLADPGTGSIGLQVRDLASAVAAFTANGGSAETRGGILWRPNGSGASFVRDLNGFLIELNQVAPSPATAARQASPAKRVAFGPI
jgi:catechol 2,3-dioxygenase-like lactoylglutathione lyase family enzyme